MAPKEEFIPKWIAWESTQRCNLSCVHCRCSSDMDAAIGDFSTEEAFKMIDDICEVSKPVMVLSGGEPLMRKDIFEIAQYGTDKGLRMCMATNGTLTRNQRRVIPCLLIYRKVQEAAEAVGLSKRTVLRWLAEDEAFRAELAQAEGRAIDQALETRKGIIRMGTAYVPMDEALARVVVDLRRYLIA